MCNRKREIPVPQGAEFRGPLADYLARFAFRLMTMTACREEYRENGYFIPFSSVHGRQLLGGNWDKVKKASVNHPVFEWNDRYSNFSGNSFCKSVRLRKEFRTGHAVLYEFRRKRSTPEFDPGNLDTIARKLFDKLYEFHLPDTPPMFENPWQAYTWERVYHKDHFGHRCQWNRFHTLITSFKHRDMLLHDYGKVVAVDIRACQPLILGMVVRNHYGMTTDLEDYFGKYREGLYEFFAEKMKVSRKAAKKALIVCIFHTLEGMRNMPIFQVFLEYFPTIATYLVCAKQVNHEQVATNCQRLESRLLVDRVTSLLPDVPLATVHDEFITLEQHQQRVRDTILSVFREQDVTPEIAGR